VVNYKLSGVKVIFVVGNCRLSFVKVICVVVWNCKLSCVTLTWVGLGN
jgi:hypothetical protein